MVGSSSEKHLRRSTEMLLRSVAKLSQETMGNRGVKGMGFSQELVEGLWL